jgi:serine/threonine-protein kinase
VCLAQRRDELEAVTASLAEKPDGAIADKAILFALELTPLDSCTRTGAVPVTIPPPDNPALRAKVTALRKKLARAKVHRVAWQPAAGLELAQPALAEARSLDYAPVEAEALLEVGLLHVSAWDFQKTRPALREAATVAQQARHDIVAAKALTELLWSWEPDSGDVAKVRADAEAAIRRAGGDARLHARLVEGIAYAASVEGQHADALLYQERAVRAYERAYPPQHPITAAANNWMGAMLMWGGRLVEAKPYVERSIAMLEETFGADHPELAEALDSLGLFHALRGQYATARRHLERALATYEASLGPDHLRTTRGPLSLAEMYYWQGKPAEARRQAKRLLAQYEKAGLPTAAPIAIVGSTFLAEGNLDQALLRCREALSILGHDKDRDWRASLCLAKVHLELGNPSEAIELASRALKVCERTLWDFGRVSGVRFVLARALWDSKRDRKRAMELAKQALAEYEDLHDHGYRYMLRDMADVKSWLRERGVN